MIDSYEFGEIVIQGKKYTSDVIIYPAEVTSWWRQEGHELHSEDLAEVLKQKPEVLIIGTGKYGLVTVLAETRRHLQEQCIEVITEDTEQACRAYNQLHPSRRVIAALHLTC